MTENEVFEHVSNLAGDYKCFDEKLTHEESLILCNLIEEIKQYRTIGTADEIKSEHKELIELSRRYLKDTNELIKYQAIGTVEEFKMLKDHLWTLNKIANDYSAIGTVEEFKRAKEMESVYGQVKRERDIAISQLEEIGVSLGQKMDEFKALKEKSIAEKAEWKFDDFTAKFGNPYRCSNCDEEFEDTYNYCPNCGCDMYAD